MLEDLGQHFVVGLAGTELSEREQQLLKELKPAGVILFSYNFTDASFPSWGKSLEKLLNQCRDLCGRENLIVSIDHEGGRVHRTPAPVTHFKAARDWEERTAEVARAMAQELKALSCNLSYAPVLDIDSEPENTVISKRAFCTSAEGATKLALEYYRALEAEGVLACGKHFPGHGGTIADSHFELPVLKQTKEELLQCELIPFQGLIKDGLQCLMTAHVLYPELDPENPATVSKTILKDLLRDELSFDGIIISDALEMKALSSISLEETLEKAVQASVDLLLVAQPQDQVPLELALKLAKTLENALFSGRIKESTLKSSQIRIEQLFKRIDSLAKPPPIESLNTLASDHQRRLSKLVSGSA